MELGPLVEDAVLAALRAPRTWRDAEPGELLRTLRDRRNMSQRHLADDSGVSQAKISRLERGLCDARWDVWRRLFDRLGYQAVIVPYPGDDEAAQDLIDQGRREREDREAGGREARWW